MVHTGDETVSGHYYTLVVNVDFSIDEFNDENVIQGRFKSVDKMCQSFGKFLRVHYT